MDTEEGNPLEQINKEEIPQPMRRFTKHTAPIHILEPTNRGNTNHTNHLITQNVEANEHTIFCTT